MLHFITATDKAQWDNFVQSHPESNFLQSWDFYEFHASRGNSIVRRLAIETKDSAQNPPQILAAYAGVVESARRGRHFAIAGGPLLDWADETLKTALFADMAQQGKAYHCAFVRFRPQAPLSELCSALPSSLKSRFHIKKSPLYLSVEHAGLLDLTLSDSELLARASQGFRRKLRKAEKDHLTVETSADPAIVDTFYDLEVAHARRQGFVPFSRDFLKKQFTAFAKNDEAKMYIAKKDGEILAMNFMIFYGPEASYHYGVSTPLGTRYSAAPLLHLTAMRDARTRGIFRYNLWGIVPKDATHHRFYGVSEFKRSFGCSEYL